MEERIKQEKMERMIEVNVSKSFGNIKRMPGKPWIILNWKQREEKD
jgi:RNase P/RNase MRP subunit POP5